MPLSQELKSELIALTLSLNKSEVQKDLWTNVSNLFRYQICLYPLLSPGHFKNLFAC